MSRTRLVLALTALAVLALPAVAGGASDEGFNASRTFEFDPDGTKCPSADWKNGVGRADSTGNSNHGLLLEKACATTVVASAGAILNNIEGTVLAPGPSLGFDFRDGSHCSGGSPRFNVTQADGTFHFVGGCANGTITPTADPDWSRASFDPYDPTDAFPVLTPGVPVTSITLIADEEGEYVLDNIQVNGECAEKPGMSRPCMP